MGDPTSSYATAGRALRVSGALETPTTIRCRHHQWGPYTSSVNWVSSCFGQLPLRIYNIDALFKKLHKMYWILVLFLLTYCLLNFNILHSFRNIIFYVWHLSCLFGIDLSLSWNECVTSESIQVTGAYIITYVLLKSIHNAPLCYCLLPKRQVLLYLIVSRTEPTRLGIQVQWCFGLSYTYSRLHEAWFECALISVVSGTSCGL
jgi:hypothetical protein